MADTSGIGCVRPGSKRASVNRSSKSCRASPKPGSRGTRTVTSSPRSRRSRDWPGRCKCPRRHCWGTSGRSWKASSTSCPIVGSTSIPPIRASVSPTPSRTWSGSSEGSTRSGRLRHRVHRSRTSPCRGPMPPRAWTLPDGSLRHTSVYPLHVDVAIDGVKAIGLDVHVDARGSLVEFYRQEWLPTPRPALQGNVSRSAVGVLRGMHFHRSQWDFWFAVTGIAFVALADLRQGSPTNGATATLRLAGDEPRGLYIPPGVAHGFFA